MVKQVVLMRFARDDTELPDTWSSDELPPPDDLPGSIFPEGDDDGGSGDSGGGDDGAGEGDEDPAIGGCTAWVAPWAARNPEQLAFNEMAASYVHNVLYPPPAGGSANEPTEAPTVAPGESDGGGEGPAPSPADDQIEPGGGLGGSDGEPTGGANNDEATSGQVNVIVIAKGGRSAGRPARPPRALAERLLIGFNRPHGDAGLPGYDNGSGGGLSGGGTGSGSGGSGGGSGTGGSGGSSGSGGGGSGGSPGGSAPVCQLVPYGVFVDSITTRLVPAPRIDQNGSEPWWRVERDSGFLVLRLNMDLLRVGAALMSDRLPSNRIAAPGIVATLSKSLAADGGIANHRLVINSSRPLSIDAGHADWEPAPHARHGVVSLFLVESAGAAVADGRDDIHEIIWVGTLIGTSYIANVFDGSKRIVSFAARQGGSSIRTPAPLWQELPHPGFIDGKLFVSLSPGAYGLREARASMGLLFWGADGDRWVAFPPGAGDASQFKRMSGRVAASRLPSCLAGAITLQQGSSGVLANGSVVTFLLVNEGSQDWHPGRYVFLVNGKEVWSIPQLYGMAFAHAQSAGQAVIFMTDAAYVYLYGSVRKMPSWYVNEVMLVDENYYFHFTTAAEKVLHCSPGGVWTDITEHLGDGHLLRYSPS